MIYYRNDVARSGIEARNITTIVTRLLDAAGEKDSSISISFVNDKAIQELNREHRGKDAPTDVLSFPLDPDTDEVERLLGDVVISVDTARAQARAYDAPLQDEISRLLIHGILHVMGHDHEQAEERAVMEAEERRLAGVIGMRWPYEA